MESREILDRWTQHHDEVSFDVYVYPDNEYSPSEYLTVDEAPETFEAFRNGTLTYVGVEVAPSVAPMFRASLWGIAYGSHYEMDTDYLKRHYVPDLISEVLADVHENGEGLKLLIEAAEREATKRRG